MLTSEDQTANAREPENNLLKTDESDSWKNEPVPQSIVIYVS